MPIYNEKNKKRWTSDNRHWYFKCQYKTFNGDTKTYCSKMYKNKIECEYEYGIFKTKHNITDDVKFDMAGYMFFEDYKKRKKYSSYESCLYVYNKWILPYFKDYSIKNINISICKNWMDMMDKNNLSVNYLNKCHNILKQILNYSIINYGLQQNYLDTLGRFEKKNSDVVKDNEKIRYITSEQFDKFISYVDDELYKCIFIFLFHTGCRKGEMLALTWDDVDFNNNIITINKTLYYKHKEGSITNTKTGNNRKIKMSSTLSKTLYDHKQLMMKYNDFSESWFIFGNSRFIAPATLDRKKHFYFQKSGIAEITIHEFRHSHISNLASLYLKKGNTDATKFFLIMSDRMGHSVDVMKKTYLHLFDNTQDEIIDLLEIL